MGKSVLSDVVWLMLGQVNNGHPASVAEILQFCPVSVFALGLNHTTAPLDLRGRLAFAPEQMAPALQGLRERLQRAVPEAALVSTCNRTELYVAAEPRRVQELVRPTVDWLAEQAASAAASCRTTAMCAKTARPRATPSAWRPGWIRWCSASRRSWAR
jgi:hypothetical protein